MMKTNNTFLKLGLFLTLLIGVGTLSNCYLVLSEKNQTKIPIYETFTGKIDTTYEVADIFITMYDSVDNPQGIFGNPISRAYTNPDNGSLMQYFENVRFETITDNYGRVSVIISDLGTQLFDPAGKEMVIIDKNCTHFGENEYPICHEFRKFYEDNHGKIYFGEPISHVYAQKSRYFQYFANVCLIWDSITNDVVLAPLGDTYLSSYEPMRYTIIDSTYPELMVVDNEQASELSVYTSVDHPFIHPFWEQTVAIYVTDESGAPIEGASVTVWVILPNGQFEIYRPADTNQNGISTFTIPALANTGIGHNELVKMRIEVESEGVTGQTVGWFRIWL
jgi:hypothetical protein